MATQRRYSIEFKRQIVQEYQGGETLHGLAKRHGISRSYLGRSRRSAADISAPGRAASFWRPESHK